MNILQDFLSRRDGKRIVRTEDVFTRPADCHRSALDMPGRRFLCVHREFYEDGSNATITTWKALAP